ncbi:kinase-like domain-containing protein, partial [Dimargaris cristalligena]
VHRGTFGVVHRGASKKTGDLVAIKITKKCENSMREWGIMAKIDGHPNIVRAIELMVGAEHVYCVLEYAEGGDLFSYAMNYGPRLLEPKVRQITRQIVAALLASGTHW